MPTKDEHPINPDWVEYYRVLEAIRKSGITNMWGAAPYLAEFTGISREIARQALLSWISHYSEISDLYLKEEA